MRKSNNNWMIKIGNSYEPEFVRSQFDKIITERIKNGKSTPNSIKYPRIVLAAVRHEGFMKDIINADLIDDRKNKKVNYFNRKGQTNPLLNLFTIAIVAFIAVILFGGLIWVSGLLNTTMHNIGINYDRTNKPTMAGYTNLTYAADSTFGAMNNSVQALRLVALCMIFALILGTVVVNSIMKIHPALFFVYILIVILSIMFAAPISNAYLDILDSGIYGGILGSFTGSSWLLLHLPLVIAITGILGAIFLFVNIIRTGQEGSL